MKSQCFLCAPPLLSDEITEVVSVLIHIRLYCFLVKTVKHIEIKVICAASFKLLLKYSLYILAVCHIKFGRKQILISRISCKCFSQESFGISVLIGIGRIKTVNAAGNCRINNRLSLFSVYNSRSPLLLGKSETSESQRPYFLHTLKTACVKSTQASDFKFIRFLLLRKPYVRNLKAG